MSHCRTFAVELVETRKSIWGILFRPYESIKVYSVCIKPGQTIFHVYFFFSFVKISVSILYLILFANPYAVVE